MATMADLPSGRWNAGPYPVQEPGRSPDRTFVVFSRPERPSSRMRAVYPGPLDLDELTQDQLRLLAQGVYVRYEELRRVLWKFTTSRPPTNRLRGVSGGLEPLRAVTFESQDGATRGAAYLPKRCSLGEATVGELAELLRSWKRAT